MKIGKYNIFISTALLFALTFSFCTKNVAGPKGDPGTPGKKGNAVETHTKAFVQPSSAWSKQEFDWESLLYVPEITQTVLEKGEIKVYVQIGTDWYDLPYIEGLYITRCRFQAGLVYLNYYHTHTVVPERPVARSYRVVVISPVQ